MHWQFGEMEFGEMKRNTSNWSNFGMLLRREGLTASAGLSCLHLLQLLSKSTHCSRRHRWKCKCTQCITVNPLTPTVTMGTAIKHPVPDWVKPSFVIFDIRALDWESECPGVKNYKWRLNPFWHRMLYSCTHMATVGVKGLINEDKPQLCWQRSLAGLRVAQTPVVPWLMTVGQCSVPAENHLTLSLPRPRLAVLTPLHSPGDSQLHCLEYCNALLPRLHTQPLSQSIKNP